MNVDRTYKGKYEAAEDYRAGVKKAMFPEPSVIEWGAQSALFMAGYHHGIILKKSMYENMNDNLRLRGIDAIATITPANEPE